MARIDETNKNIQIFTIPGPRFAGHVPSWNPSSLAEEAYPQNYMVGQPKESHLGPAFREVPYALFFPRLEDELQNRCVFWFYLPWEAMRWIKKSRDGYSCGRS